MRRLVGALVALALLAAAWRNADLLIGWLALKPDGAIVEIAPDPAYEALVPPHVELCAASRWGKQVAGAGAPFGHGVMYLKGAYLDADAPYTQLRRCAHAAADVDAPEHGAGVSVGRRFRNVNWVGAPSHALLYGGGPDPCAA